jgi:nucleoid-associated protein YgaU
MTRENKLALVIGFGLILFVGVLVSDHFSTASKQQVADLSRGEPPLVAATLVKPQIIDLDPVGYGRKESTPDAGHSTSQQAAEGQVQSITDGTASPTDPNYVPPGFEQVLRMPEQPVDRVTVEELPQRLVESQTVAFHDVTAGQTLYSICMAHYEDPSLVQALARFNQLGDARNMKVGRRLRIPQASFLRGEAREVSSSKAQGHDGGTGTTSKSGAYTLYTVKSNDTLSRIAQQMLGSRGRVQELIDLNQDLLDDPNQLKVGAQIRVPARSQARAR